MHGALRGQLALEKSEFLYGKMWKVRFLVLVEKYSGFSGCRNLEPGQGDMRGKGALLQGDAAGLDDFINLCRQIIQAGFRLESDP